jgi:hypothetical protein
LVTLPCPLPRHNGRPTGAEITFPKENNRVEIKFGYNIDDVRFWDKSIVWKKGNRIPGYYGFQTKGK